MKGHLLWGQYILKRVIFLSLLRGSFWFSLIAPDKKYKVGWQYERNAMQLWLIHFLFIFLLLDLQPCNISGKSDFQHEGSISPRAETEALLDLCHCVKREEAAHLELIPVPILTSQRGTFHFFIFKHTLPEKKTKLELANVPKGKVFLFWRKQITLQTKSQWIMHKLCLNHLTVS